jgi:hypothetical protein
MDNFNFLCVVKLLTYWIRNEPDVLKEVVFHEQTTDLAQLVQTVQQRPTLHRQF